MECLAHDERKLELIQVCCKSLHVPWAIAKVEQNVIDEVELEGVRD
jgi:hypothetical protein